MKLSLKKITSMFLAVLVVVLSAGFNIYADEVEEATETPSMTQEQIDAMIDAEVGVEGFAARQRLAREVFEQMYESFERDVNGDIIYPDFFGGAYINDEGNLTVLITEAAQTNAAGLQNFCLALLIMLNWSM